MCNDGLSVDGIVLLAIYTVPELFSILIVEGSTFEYCYTKASE